MPPRHKIMAIPGPVFPDDLTVTPYTSDCNILYTTTETTDPDFVIVMQYSQLVVKDLFRFQRSSKFQNCCIPSSYAPHIWFVNHLHTYGMLWHHLHEDWESISTSGWDKLSVYLTKVMIQFLGMADKANTADQMSTKWRCSFFDKFLTREFFGVPHVPAMAEAELKKDHSQKIDLSADPFTLGKPNLLLMWGTNYHGIRLDKLFSTQSHPLWSSRERHSQHEVYKHKRLNSIHQDVSRVHTRGSRTVPTTTQIAREEVQKIVETQSCGDESVEGQNAGAKKHGRSTGKGKGKAGKEKAGHKVDINPPAELTDDEEQDCACPGTSSHKCGRSTGKGKGKAGKETAGHEVDIDPPAELTDDEGNNKTMHIQEPPPINKRCDRKVRWSGHNLLDQGTNYNQPIVVEPEPGRKPVSRSRKIGVKDIISNPNLLMFKSGDKSLDTLLAPTKFVIRLPTRGQKHDVLTGGKKVEPVPSGSGEPPMHANKLIDKKPNAPSTTMPNITLTRYTSQYSLPSPTPPARSLTPSHHSLSTGNPDKSLDDEDSTVEKSMGLANLNIGNQVESQDDKDPTIDESMNQVDIETSGEGDKVDEVDEDAEMTLDRPHIQLFTQQGNESEEPSDMDISPVQSSKKAQTADVRFQPLQGFDPTENSHNIADGKEEPESSSNQEQFMQQHEQMIDDANMSNLGKHPSTAFS
ncbi:hypothetical protein JAAARDRAFT_194876 [Jaapia argillacea MUCL 33604]|uniref:Uncharacterized protein n=1 Tax=Jaapia argillacea MUCL 33604 TaxID=933084 RepID=A0A067Q0S8_9AGAM|nr:hypothetical protein JAAARDRAFT_194876 [Jaapia argillacea MUCL 33604]